MIIISCEKNRSRMWNRRRLFG